MSADLHGIAQTVWDEWFDVQYDLNQCIDRAIKEQSRDKGDGFRAAVYAGVIEHCAEAMRGYIPDVALTPADSPTPPE